MMELLTSPEAWIALFTLATLEIVLGIDNLVFVSIAVSRLPPSRRDFARRFGIAVACLTRIGLLLTLAYLARMSEPLFLLFGQGISIRDLILILGGIFLVVKGALEIRSAIAGEEDSAGEGKASAVFALVIAQIAVIDIVFSLDSVITAVGMVDQVPIMVGAILIAVTLMFFAANPLGHFIDANPTVKMLALAFIVLVGLVLVADGFGFHIPRPYVYVAMGFSGVVEVLNLMARRHLLRHDGQDR
ncbi:TerC family protein [Coralloluteibacterium stylophorae]|uniref:TerC family protein n=1 Tax=Coralloluteibacterium stylophorae TaxID=1776034 RepID=A0A8J7VTA0_9GAMM|nr:TerC family protein [Coralloluteibacterium stylophorae]MBS7456113.1 TerC family protein [Coralloluteibacterium stylophorae]